MIDELRHWLFDPKTWEAAAEAIGRHPHEYDMGDSSERLDVVQIVCEALDRVIEGGQKAYQSGAAKGLAALYQSDDFRDGHTA